MRKGCCGIAMGPSRLLKGPVRMRGSMSPRASPDATQAYRDTRMPSTPHVVDTSCHQQHVPSFPHALHARLSSPLIPAGTCAFRCAVAGARRQQQFYEAMLVLVSGLSVHTAPRFTTSVERRCAEEVVVVDKALCRRLREHKVDAVEVRRHKLIRKVRWRQ